MRSSWLRPKGIGVALVVGLVALQASAQWVWRDRSGQLHASDLPPPREVPDSQVLRRPAVQQRLAAASEAAEAAQPAASAASAPQAGAPAKDPELQARRERAEQEEALRRQEEAARRRKEEQRVAQVKAENCQRARDHLRTLDSGMRIARLNAQGEREILDDQMRAAETRRAREAIAQNCR